MGKTTIYLARHGETVDNVNKIMQGQTQGELTEKGRIQAKELGRKLADIVFDAYVSSDLKRSVDTCAIVASASGKPVVTTPLLRERDWGSFTGRYIPDLKDEVWPDDIESLDKLKERAGRFLRWAHERFPNQTILAVGHGIINKAIQAVLFNKQMNEVMRMENGEVRILTVE